MAGYNQPRSRKKNVVDSGKEIEKKGNGLGTGGVGMNAAGSQPRRSGEERAEKKDTYKPSAKPSAETVKRVGEAFQTGVKAIAKAAADPVGTIKKGAQAVGKAASDLATTARKNGYGPKATATYVADEPGRKGQPMNISSSVKMRVGGAGMNAGGKAVKRDANAAKDSLSKKAPAKDALASTEKKAPRATPTPYGEKDTLGTKSSGSNASASKTGNGFLSKVKSSTTSKDRINAALNYVGGKKTAKADTAKATAKTEKSNKQKAKKNKAAAVKSEAISGPFNATEAMKQRRAAAEAAGKGKFNATEEMKKRRAAAEAAGKGKFNATEEMKKRRAAAEAQGKGKWNAQEEMRKRREAAQSKKRIQQAMGGKGK